MGSRGMGTDDDEDNGEGAGARDGELSVASSDADVPDKTYSADAERADGHVGRGMWVEPRKDRDCSGP
jgi:hypothetical protein